MAFHHLAIATRDLKATHEFYTGPMGFELVKVVAGETPEKGWAKHLFYDTGGDIIEDLGTLEYLKERIARAHFGEDVE